MVFWKKKSAIATITDLSNNDDLSKENIDDDDEKLDDFISKN